jgi:zinc protease
MTGAAIARGRDGISVATSGRVQELITAKGIRAYLVAEPAVPVLSLSFWFRGGAAADPEHLAGLAHMTSGVIDEGAGPYDSQAFRRELEDRAIRLSFDADRDGFMGELKTLTLHREHAFELLRLALTEARFDDEPVERVRSQLVVDLRRRETEPDYLASRAWFEAAFPDHPYRLPTRGTLESVARIDAAAMRDYVARRLARDSLLVGVAGDIEPATLAPLLDRTFGDLPAEAASVVEVEAPPVVGETRVTRLAIPQSVVTFGHAGISRRDPDRYAAFVANHILGGGGFSSRLIEEVREKRGLAYSVYSYLYDTKAAPLWLGGVATGNERVGESLSLIRAERQRMARGDIGAEELADAKTYLTGSFPLRLTSNDQVVKTLMGMLVDDLGRDFLERRNGYIEAVTLDDARRASARLFSRELLVSVVGAPVGL